MYTWIRWSPQATLLLFLVSKLVNVMSMNVLCTLTIFVELDELQRCACMVRKLVWKLRVCNYVRCEALKTSCGMKWWWTDGWWGQVLQKNVSWSSAPATTDCAVPSILPLIVYDDAYNMTTYSSYIKLIQHTVQYCFRMSLTSLHLIVDGALGSSRPEKASSRKRSLISYLQLLHTSR